MVLSQKRANTPTNPILKAWLSTTDPQKHPGKENKIQQDSDLQRAIELSLQESQKEKRQEQLPIIMSDDDDNDFQPFPRIKRLCIPKNKQRRRTRTENNSDSQLPLSTDYEEKNYIKDNVSTQQQRKQQQPANPVKIKKERHLEAEEEHVIHFDDLYDEEDSNIKQENGCTKVKQEVPVVEEEEEFVVEFEDFNSSPIIKHEDKVNTSKIATFDIDETTTTETQPATTSTARLSNDTQDTEVDDLTNWTPSFNSRDIFTPSPPSIPYNKTLKSPLPFSLDNTSSYATALESSSPFHTTNITASNRDKGKRPARTITESSIPSSTPPPPPSSSTLDTLNIPKRRKHDQDYSSSLLFIQDNDTNNNTLMANNNDKEHKCPLCNKLFSFDIIEAHASDCMADNADISTIEPSNSRSSSSNKRYNGNQESPILLIDQRQNQTDISSRERRHQNLDRLASQRRRRTPTPIVDGTYSDIEEYSDDNGVNELKTCVLCEAAIPVKDLERHIDEELNNLDQKDQQRQDQQSSAEPRSSSSMADLRDSFRDNVMVLSDAEDSRSDSDGVIDLSGPGPIPFDYNNDSNYNNNDGDDDDDDGYLSPLEGFESINPQDHPQYYNQGTRQTSSSSSQQRRTPGRSSSAPKRRRGGSRQGRGSKRTPAQNRAIHARRAQKRGLSKGSGGNKKSRASGKPKGKK
ncbi:hypothetical protein INT45_010181 [Circinella minor]|uniref:UBZ4-type domain-containing protein n=1 Tax=Circinella minor TaxID=1195481 RepID=A0A8H7SEY3_9FUNG|nr:hypothetical protein INT45_010181 [Circinella minor]